MSDSKKEKTMFEFDEKEAIGEACCAAAEKGEQEYWEAQERLFAASKEAREKLQEELEQALFQ